MPADQNVLPFVVVASGRQRSGPLYCVDRKRAPVQFEPLLSLGCCIEMRSCAVDRGDLTTVEFGSDLCARPCGHAGRGVTWGRSNDCCLSLSRAPLRLSRAPLRLSRGGGSPEGAVFHVGLRPAKFPLK